MIKEWTRIPNTAENIHNFIRLSEKSVHSKANNCLFSMKNGDKLRQKCIISLSVHQNANNDFQIIIQINYMFTDNRVGN